MAAVKEHVLLIHPDCQVLLAEIPVADPCDDSPQAPPTVTLRLLVEVCGDYGNGPLGVVDVETMEEVACRVPRSDLGRCPGAADRAFSDLVARIGYQRLRQEAAAQITAAGPAVRVWERCIEERVDELRSVEFRLRVMFFDDAFDEWSDLESDDDESGSDMDDGDGVGCSAQPKEP